jgi:prepilin-type N-terminal cleavage/methylation domain-containing protein
MRIRHIFNQSKGFTLIELLIVLAIIGTLTGVVMVNILSARERGRDAERKSELRQLQTAFEIYRADQGTYPPSPLPACDTALAAGGTTYIQKIPCDPTNSGQHVFTYTTTGTTYSLFACLENERDQQRDKVNNATYCNGTSNASFTLTNP